MKNTYRNITFFTTPLFLLSILAAGYVLFHFPENLANNLGIIDKKEISKIQSSMYTLYIAVGLTWLIGFLSIFIYLFAFQKQQIINHLAHESETSDYTSKSKVNSTENVSSSEGLLNKRVQILTEVLGQESTSPENAKWEKVLGVICNEIEASQGAFYEVKEVSNKKIIEFKAGYAFYQPESKPVQYEFGEGLAGQVAKEGKMINIPSVPEGYLTILSGLGKSDPGNLLIVPIKKQGIVTGLLEIASFTKFTKNDEDFLQSASEMLTK